MKNKTIKYGKCVAVLMWYGDRFLMSQRLKTATFSGYWGLPGGQVEPDEGVTTAAQREIKEETNVFVLKDSLELLDCLTELPHVEKTFFFETNIHPMNFSDVKQTEPKKHGPWKLFTIDEALKMDIMPGLRMILESGVDKPSTLH